VVVSLLFDVLVWFLFFLGSLLEQVLHSFIPLIFFFIAHSITFVTLRVILIFCMFSSPICNVLLLCLLAAYQSSDDDSPIAVICISYHPSHCPTRLNRHVVTSLFFHTPKTSLRLSRCNSKLPCLSTDVFHNFQTSSDLSPSPRRSSC